eukprot:UN23772
MSAQLFGDDLGWLSGLEEKIAPSKYRNEYKKENNIDPDDHWVMEVENRVFLQSFPYIDDNLAEKIRGVIQRKMKYFSDNQVSHKRKALRALTSCFSFHYDISDLIYEYSKMLYDGIWFTQARVYLSELKNGTLIGTYGEYVLVGKSFGTEFFFHQYHENPCQRKITVKGKLSSDHSQLECEYRVESYEWAPLTIMRSPPKEQQLLLYASESNIKGLEEYKKQGFTLNVQLKEFQMFSPLHAAVARSRPESIKWLLENGCNPELKNDWGVTAYDMAVRDEDKVCLGVFKNR